MNYLTSRCRRPMVTQTGFLAYVKKPAFPGLGRPLPPHGMGNSSGWYIFDMYPA